MQTTWRERNQQNRLKAAKEALEKNPELVLHDYCLLFYLLTVIGIETAPAIHPFIANDMRVTNRVIIIKI